MLPNTAIRTVFLLALLCVMQTSFTCAQRVTISGYVSDSASGEKLLNAGVFDARTLAGTVSNAYGYYSLTLPADTVVLSISYVGYVPDIRLLKLSRDTVLNITLKRATALSEVVIHANRSESLAERSSMSTMEIPVSQIRALPAFLGEVDVLKALQLLPGVQGGTEGTSGLYIRGGSPDQNLILLDGVPVYNATHLFGFFSVFNADAINTVTLIKGGFPARYGGRLSGVVDIRMKEGNMQSFHGEGSVGLVASRLTLEGPIKKNKSSFLVSARRTYLDLIARPIIKATQDGQVSGYYFYDLSAKVNYLFSQKDRLYLSTYSGRDKAYFNDSFQYDDNTYETDKNGLSWGNTTAVLRWNHIPGNRMFSNLTATYTAYSFDIYSNTYLNDNSTVTRSTGLEYYSGIRDWSLREDLDIMPSANHYIKAGAGVTFHTFMPGATEFAQETGGVSEGEISLATQNIHATEFDVYAEDDWTVSKKIKINYGLHASAFAVQNTFYRSLQPRIALRYLITEDLSVKASFCTMSQYIHLLTNAGIGLPTDLWVPATAEIPPQRAWQPALGLAWTHAQFECSIEGYYKEMHNVIEYKDGESYLYNGESDWQDKVEPGNGLSYGVELFVQKKEGRISGWAGYTLAWSNRIFPTINLGNEFPFKYDRRHEVDIALIWKLSDHIGLSGDWTFASGLPVTIPTAKYTGLFGETLYYYEGRNAYRMEPYHRLDLNISLHKEKKHGLRTWNFGVYNAYNRLNPFFIYESYDHETHENYYKQVSLFPIIPYVSFDFKF